MASTWRKGNNASRTANTIGSTAASAPGARDLAARDAQQAAALLLELDTLQVHVRDLTRQVRAAEAAVARDEAQLDQLAVHTAALDTLTATILGQAARAREHATDVSQWAGEWAERASGYAPSVDATLHLDRALAMLETNLDVAISTPSSSTGPAVGPDQIAASLTAATRSMPPAAFRSHLTTRLPELALPPLPTLQPVDAVLDAALATHLDLIDATATCATDIGALKTEIRAALAQIPDTDCDYVATHAEVAALEHALAWVEVHVPHYGHHQDHDEIPTHSGVTVDPNALTALRTALTAASTAIPTAATAQLESTRASASTLSTSRALPAVDTAALAAIDHVTAGADAAPRTATADWAGGVASHVAVHRAISARVLSARAARETAAVEAAATQVPTDVAERVDEVSAVAADVARKREERAARARDEVAAASGTGAGAAMARVYREQLDLVEGREWADVLGTAEALRSFKRAQGASGRRGGE
ncbi:hypothetical protein AMAG_14601 [Allomyces macrogynus ATCC 38327]|uniref:Uncharacterized protein n=1 Tax=Allomyces macrogynus (strain ATCC 38327) TaxID=578462 RepID=A0A0L0T722_ALLM3|nr:hypothetical protein AMAG_14601 [Allomyces macrogynus ATCC 38327]|eukprot:KNE70476.1 hypothetical protein AMAG_14601 [Allomyces macrogynus ATCC 38327]